MISKTAADIWKDYDPVKESLDIKIISEWEEEGIRFKEVYFTGRSIENGRSRIYAVYSTPVGSGKNPGILHIHGGGQTVNIEWLKFWGGLGYAALSYNWGGEWPNREKYTLWGPFTYANHKKVEPIATKHPSQAYDSWYEWTLAARRAVTFLESQPEVDREKIGVFGISMGGSLVWRIAATDERLKAACAIYGCGWEEQAETFKYGEGVVSEEEKPEVLRWNTQMAPQAYAPYLKAPILYLSGTNDFWGNMERAFDTLDAVPADIERRQAFTPGFNHHIGAGFVMNLPLWMDRWLKTGKDWPQTPRLQISLDSEGVPAAVLLAENMEDIRGVETCYSVENPNAYFRHWRKTESRKMEGSWIASLPVADTGKQVFAFANIAYGSGIVISSNLSVAVPAELGSAKATDSPSGILFDASGELDSDTAGWVTNSPGTNPIPPVPVPLKTIRWKDGRKALALQGNYSLHTYKVGDSKWRGRRGAKLHLQVLSRKDDCFSVVAGCMKGAVDRGTSETFYSSVYIEGKEEWQVIELPESAFHSNEGEDVLKDWSGINYLQIKKPDTQWADAHILFTDIQWV